jgi:hypothetical protein
VSSAHTNHKAGFSAAVHHALAVRLLFLVCNFQQSDPFLTDRERAYFGLSRRTNNSTTVL